MSIMHPYRGLVRREWEHIRGLTRVAQVNFSEHFYYLVFIHDLASRNIEC